MGGSSQTTKEQQTATNTTDPALMAMLQGNYAAAQDRANTLTPYTGAVTAGFTPTQTQAQGVLSGIATDPRYAATAQQAVGATQGVLNSDPLATANLQKYMNPFQSQVIDASIAQNQYARDQQGVKDNAAATAANAFGGTRQAVQNAETNAGYDRNNQQNIAALNSANFGQAQTAALSGANLNLNAATNLANLNNSALQTNATRGGILGAVGDAQQAQQQAELTNAYNAYMAGQQLTVQQQQLLNSALGLIPNQQTVVSNGTNTTQKSGDLFGGILGAITGGAKIGASLYGG